MRRMPLAGQREHRCWGHLQLCLGGVLLPPRPNRAPLGGVEILLRLCEQLTSHLGTVTCSTAEASEEEALSQQRAQMHGGSRLSQQLQSPSPPQAVQSPRRTASIGRHAPEADAGQGRQPPPAGGDVAILIEGSGDSRKTTRFRLSLTSMCAL